MRVMDEQNQSGERCVPRNSSKSNKVKGFQGTYVTLFLELFSLILPNELKTKIDCKSTSILRFYLFEAKSNYLQIVSKTKGVIGSIQRKFEMLEHSKNFSHQY